MSVLEHKINVICKNYLHGFVMFHTQKNGIHRWKCCLEQQKLAPTLLQNDETNKARQV